MNKSADNIMKNFVIGVLIGVILLLIIGFQFYTIEKQVEIVDLENHVAQLKEEMKYEDTELNPCYLCNGVVKLKQVNDSFYIECESCKLKTAFFEFKTELTKYWNKCLEEGNNG